MEIIYLRKNDILILKVDGRIDSNTSPQFYENVLEFISGGDKRIILDFSKVEFISSACIRAIYQLLEKSKNAQSRLVIAEPIKSVKKVFDIVMLQSEFSIFDKTDEALNYLTV